MKNIKESLLENVKVKDLKEIAKLVGLQGYSKMKKEELFDAFFIDLEVNKGIQFVSDSSSVNGYIYTIHLDEEEEIDEYTICVSKPVNKWHKDFLKSKITNREEDTEVISYYANSSNGILKINTLQDYLFCRLIFGTIGNEDVTFLDMNNVSKWYDGVMFTSQCIKECDVNKEYSLSEFKYGFVSIFNDDIVSKAVNITVSESLIMELENSIEDSKAVLRKRQQFQLKNINVMDLCYSSSNKRIELPLDGGITVATSENRIFRDYNEPTIDKQTFSLKGLDIKEFKENNKDNNIEFNKKEGTVTVTTKVNRVPSFIVVNSVPCTVGLTKEEVEKVMTKREMLLDIIIPLGFYCQETGKTYHVVAQSASQQRTGKYIFTSNDVDEVRTKLLYGYDFGKEFVRTTKEARNGLAFTSAMLIEDFHPSIKVLEDPWETVHCKTIVPTGVKPEKGTVEIYDEATKEILIKRDEMDMSFQPNDGNAFMQIIAFSEVCCKLGIISKKEFRFFRKHYKSIFQLEEIRAKENLTKEEVKLLKIFMKLPPVLQIRYGGCKGLITKFPVKDYRPDLTEDIIAGDNFVKFQLENYSEVNFEVCGLPTDEGDMLQMNYQFLQFLNISAEDLCTMAGERLDKISDTILSNAKEALSFLGMIENICSDESSGIVSRFTKVLACNPDMLQDVYVQKNIKNLISKYIYDIAFGRLPVEGSYQYVISDPFHFMANAGLTKEEIEEDKYGLNELVMDKDHNYSDDYVGWLGLFRSPMTCGDEIQKVWFDHNDKLWFLNGIIILNGKRLTLPGAGGASL